MIGNNQEVIRRASMERNLVKTAIALILTILASHICLAHNKQVVGYYPNWQWYRRNQLVRPQTIDYQKYTVINYAFFNPMENGTIALTDSWADENILLGPMIWWPEEMHDTTQSLPYLAHQAGVKVLPSIGGWTLSGNFPSIAADPVKRQNFVQSCVYLIQTYDFDGIDLDWEYPGYAEHNGSPADFYNFPLLLQELRSALDSLETQVGSELIITSCFNASRVRMQDIDWPNVLPLIDMVNLMSYDYHGSWDALSNFNSPLYSPSQGDPEWCVAESFEILTQEFYVPPAMINVGIPFYGKALANCTQLYGTHTGYDMATFGLDEGQPHYYTILNALPAFTYYWNDDVKCPYLLGNSINTFVTYDDTLSVGFKTQYAKDHGAMGVIIWEITGDYLETAPESGVIAGTPLVDRIHNIFNLPDYLMPPDNLEYTVDSNSVILSWIPSSDIPEMEYNIYRNNIRINPVPIMGITFQDTGVTAGNTYVYYVTSCYGQQESVPSNLVTVTLEITGNEDETAVMLRGMLYPNPFSARVELAFKADRNSNIRLSIYNSRGQKVYHAKDIAVYSGKGRFEWNGKDKNGNNLPSGIYLFRISSDFQEKMIGKTQDSILGKPDTFTVKGCLVR
jgi:GH18 family chitinase